MNEHAWLVVGVSGECAGLLGGNRRVPVDQRRHHPSGRFDAETERGHVEKEEALHGGVRVSAEYGGLHRGSVSHSLVRIDRLVQLLAVEKVPEQRLNFRDSGRAADQDDFVNLWKISEVMNGN